MNIVVCYKIVPDEEGIAIKADRSVDVSGAQWSLGEYDLEALEAAVQLRDSVGGKVTVLTVGGDEVLNSKLKKSILSRGADDQIVVCSEAFANLDAYCTAEVLARALGSTEYDLVLCGEGSSDMYSQQVGMILGQMLGLPVFNAAAACALHRVLAGGGELWLRRVRLGRAGCRAQRGADRDHPAGGAFRCGRYRNSEDPQHEGYTCRRQETSDTA